MNGNNLWEKYCSFYEQSFSEQIDYNVKRLERYFQKWKKTELAKILCKTTPRRFQDVPVTVYSDYTMLDEFGRKISELTKRNPKKRGELFREYYDRIDQEIGSALNRYMVEPFYFCIKTTGTTGMNKWIAHGETFWENFKMSSIATAVVACSDGWGETNLKLGDKCLNATAPIPYISGWGALASQMELELVPPIEVTDNLQNIKAKFILLLKAIDKGEKISLGGGIGSMFYMICKYFVEPEKFYEESYTSMSFGLRKMLLSLKLLQYKLIKNERRRITDFIPLKGVLVAGVEARLYMDFFKEEFDLKPLHIYGSTEAGTLMKGDPDRKEDLIPDLRTSYLEFKTPDGEIKGLDELKKGEVYDIIVTPFGSILFRYDMEDLLRVVDFRDDGMPVFAFEGRKRTVIELYSRYTITPNVVVQALAKAGLRSSDKWAVVKLHKPREHLHFLMEKTWPYSEREAEKIIFNSLMEVSKNIPSTGDVLRDYIEHFRIKDPSEVVKVEYLKPGAFLRYTMKKARAGSPLGQYKPPKIISSDRMEIYETLKNS